MTINSVNILVPLNNEEKGIKNLVENLTLILDKIDKQTNITLIDDHSSDQTWNILKQYEQKFDFIKIYKNEKLTGFGNALRFGINKNHDDAIIFYMGDCADSPRDIIEYVKYLDQGYDCVFGSRFIKGSKLYDYPLVKLIVNRLVNNFIRLLFLIKYNDITNAFKAYTKEVLNQTSPIISEHFNIGTEISLRSIIRGYKYKVIPTSWTDRRKGKSKFQMKEMKNRYLFTIFFVFLEKILLRKDIRVKKIIANTKDIHKN